MIDRMLAAAALAASTPLLAQPPTPPAAPPASARAAEAIDPARLAAAERMVDAAMPRDWLATAFAGQAEEEAERAATQAAQDAEAIARDPHHVERTRLTERASAAEMAKIFAELEPELRSMFARAFARHMGAVELERTAAFYASPIGQRLLEQSLAMSTSAEETERMVQALQPALIALLPGLDQRLAAATAHLPPPWKITAGPGAPLSDELTAAMAAAGAASLAASPPAEGSAPDPAKVAAARRVLDLLWPADYFKGPVPLQTVVDGLLAMRVAEFGVSLPPQARVSPDATVGEALVAQDPNLMEVVRAFTRFAGEEMGRALVAIEPPLKRYYSEAYARYFNLDELGQLGSFYASPAGQQLAAASFELLRDPELIADGVRLLPRFISAGPAMAQRVAAATAHLPPPPPPPAEAEAEDQPLEGQRRRRRR